MNRRIFIIFAFCFFLFVFGLSAQDTWVKSYRPFQRADWTDRYEVEDVIVTQDGGYVVSGSYELFGYEPWEYENWAFLMKTDSDGNILWAVNDSVDFLYSNGYNIDFTELPDGSLLSIGIQGPGGGRYMIKRDSEGNRLWTMPYEENFGIFSMKTTTDGNVILAGRSEYNAALRKITPDGETIWTKIIEVGSSIATSVYEASDGGYLLTGINYEDYDVLVIKTDANGDSLWTRTFPGLGGDDQGNCIIETEDENIIVVGEIHSQTLDTFIAVISSQGDIIWQNIITNLSICYSIIQSQDNNYVGYSWSGSSVQKTRLFKIDSSCNILWNNQLSNWPAVGDKCFSELQNGGFICAGIEYLGTNIILNKTSSTGQITDIQNDIVFLSNYVLYNYPNPFNPETIISFNISEEMDITLKIYNIKGQLVETLMQKHLDQGLHSVVWNASNQASGIYFIRLFNEKGLSKTSKAILLK